ncbi:hypothetical protein HPB52_007676 [Rhipicephalus sanguineus]|uniref:W2 domain-containing protein n=2 Tax=Rhipicephalus sanguineus TaxID=34632 RepID=A0A9D4SY66_RHISA|nr:hypothetical protein HPB52_007676 [Rhipicephalus sanguineus]
MADCLLGLEEFVALHEQYSTAVGGILKWMYDQELLSEESIVRWFQEHSLGTPGPAGLVRKAAAKFVQWLQEAEEESDESEEESD